MTIRVLLADDQALLRQTFRILLDSCPDIEDVLTAREREVVALAAHGLSNEDIAEQLFVSPYTARTHVHRAMSKLNARDRAQLVVIAYQSGLVTITHD